MSEHHRPFTVTTCEPPATTETEPEPLVKHKEGTLIVHIIQLHTITGKGGCFHTTGGSTRDSVILRIKSLNKN